MVERLNLDALSEKKETFQENHLPAGNAALAAQIRTFLNGIQLNVPDDKLKYIIYYAIRKAAMFDNEIRSYYIRNTLGCLTDLNGKLEYSHVRMSVQAELRLIAAAGQHAAVKAASEGASLMYGDRHWATIESIRKAEADSNANEDPDGFLEQALNRL